MSYFSPVKYIDDPDTLAAIQELLAGNLSQAWLQVGERVRVRPKDPERGLTYEDCNVGGYGYDALPESVVNHPSMIPRGCAEESGFPDLGYTVNRKSDIWADNVAQLFEEAKARSWNPATDIDWQAIQAAHIPPEIENAFCQLCTFFAEAGFFGADILGRWIVRTNQMFLEAKSLMGMQLLEGMKLGEVFWKRALVRGEGPGVVNAVAEQLFKRLLLLPSFWEVTVAFHFVLIHFLLALARQAAHSAPCGQDQRILQFTMQDIARCMAYGQNHLRYMLTHHPGRGDDAVELLTEVERMVVAVLASPELTEPLIILAGGGTSPAQIRMGGERLGHFFGQAVEEYFQRCRAVGLPERSGESPLAKAFGLLG